MSALLAAGLLAASPADAAMPKGIQVRLTLVVHADMTDSTVVDRSLRIDAPAGLPEVRAVLVAQEGTPEYSAALTTLLCDLGLYDHKMLAPLLANASDAPPETDVAAGRATILFKGSRDLAVDLVSGLKQGLWEVNRSGDRVSFTLPAKRPVPAGVAWTVQVYAAGTKILGTSPKPDARGRVAHLPDPADAQVEPKDPPLETGAGGIPWAEWDLPAGTSADAGKLAFQLRVDHSTQIAIASFDGYWGHVRLALLYLAATIFFLPLLWFAWRSLRDRRPSAGLVWAAVGLWAAVVGAGAATWLVNGASVSSDVDNVRPALVVGGLLTLLLALTVRRRAARAALVAGAVAAGGAWWAQTEIRHVAFFGTGDAGGVAEAAWSAAAIALPVLAVVGLLTWLLLRPTSAGKWLPKPWVLAVVVAGAAALLLGQTATAGYHEWDRRHDILQALAPAAEYGSGTSWVMAYLLYYPLSFLSLAGDLLPLVAFAAIVAILWNYSRGANSTLIRLESVGAFWLVGLMFAAFVAGTDGSVYTWRVPLAFVLAFALWALPLRRTVERDVKESKHEPAALMAARGPVLRSAATPDAKAPAPTVPTPLAMSLGPGKTWWENGCIGVRWGALLATIPVGYYLYVLFSQRLAHDLSPWNAGGLPDLLRSIVHEFVLWLAAAFALGAVFPYLPGTRGALKGAALGGFYFAVLGLSVWILPGSGGDWFFRAFEVFLLLLVLGIVLDWRTLHEHGVDWSYLKEYYYVADVRFAAGYASTAIGALVVIVQQLQSGDAHGAITQIIKSLPDLIPPLAP